MNNFLSSVYNKIIKQSKKKFFFDNFLIPDSTWLRLEVFQLNLIIILWYMNTSKVEKKKMESIILYFLKDLEYLLRESGEADSRIPKKTRALVENFYGRLSVYSENFIKLVNKEKCDLENKLKLNFNSSKIDYKKLKKYTEKNVLHFSKLKKDDFINMSFDFVE